MCKAMMNLAVHEMGIFEVDALVSADEKILADRYNAKDRRAVRVEDEKKAKKYNERLYNPADVIKWGEKAEFNVERGITPVFHGEDEPVAFIKKSTKNLTKQTMNKVANRKVRYQRFEEA